MPNIDALLRGIRDRLAQENAVANQRGYPGYTPPTNPNQVLQAQSATAMQAALANQDAFVNRRRGAIPAPGIDYAGGGSGVTANDIMGQYGPVVTQPRPQPVPQPTLPPGAQAAESQYYGNMYQEAERQNALNAMIPGQFAAMQAQVQQGQAALPVRGTVPQMQDILKFEANTQLPSGNGWTPPVTQDPNGPSIADLAAYRNEQGQIAWETSWRDLQSAQEALQMADVAFRANPSDDNRLALNRAENNVKLASNKWQVVQENYQPDRVDPISGVAMPALNALDIPRQKVVEEMGANAYDVATGDSSSWSPGLAGVAMANWNFPGLGRLTQDFETWANDPKNWQIIRNASENGFQASPEMPKFTGGRAVWELFINTAGGFYKAAMDTFLDPTIMFGAAKSVGAGTRLIGEGAAAGDAGIISKAIGNTLRAAGTALEAPQIISDKSVDAIIPGAIKSAKVVIGGGLELLPGESGSRIVGKADKLVAKSAQEMARSAGDESISAASNTIYAAQEMRGLPSLPVDPNVVPGDPTQMDLINAANPAGYVTRPDGRSIPLFPGTTEEQLATPSVVPDVRKDSYQPGMAHAENPLGDQPLSTLPTPSNKVVFPGTEPGAIVSSKPRPDVPIDPVTGRPMLLDQYGRAMQPTPSAMPETGTSAPVLQPREVTPPVIPSIVPDPEITPVERDWTRTPEVEQTFSDLRSRYPSEQVDRYVAQWEANSQAYRAADAGTTGTTRMPTAHAEYVVRQYQAMREFFPDEALPAYEFRAETGSGNRQALIERAIFGSDEEYLAAMRRLRDNKAFSWQDPKTGGRINILQEIKRIRQQAKSLQLAPDAPKNAPRITYPDAPNGVAYVRVRDLVDRQDPELVRYISSDERKQIDDIKRSIEQNGFDPNQPVTVGFNRSGRSGVIEGNHRLIAASELGMEWVPVRSVRSQYDDPSWWKEVPGLASDIENDINGRRIFWGSDSDINGAPSFGGVKNPSAASATPTASSAAMPAPDERMLSEATVPIDSLKVRPEDMQPRVDGQGGIDPQRVETLRKNWDWSQYDRIKVWRDPATNELVVLEGHHRYTTMRALGITDVPVRVYEGSFEDAKRLARWSNSRGKPLSPVSLGQAIVAEEADGSGFDRIKDLASGQVRKAGDVQLYKNLTYLPNELQMYVDSGQLSVKQGSLLGDAVNTGLMSKPEAAAFYLSRIVPKGYSDSGLADTLRVMAEMKKAASPQATMTSMFGDADLGGSGASAAMDRIDELAALRRKLKGQAAAISSTMKVDLPEIKAANDSLAKGKATLEARVRDLEVELGIGKRPPGKRTGQAVGIVPQEPYFVRLSKFQKAQSAAEKSQAEAMTARIAGKDTGAPRTGPIVSDKTADTLNQTFQSNPKYIGQTHRQVLEGMLGKRLEDSTLEELHAVGAGFRDAISVEMNVPDPNLWERTMVRAARGFSAFTLLPLWNAPKMLLINTGIGNSTQAMIGGQAAAIRKMWDWDHVKALEKAAFKNEIPRSSPMWEAAEGWGLGGFNPKHSGHSVIDAVAEKRVESKIKSAAGKATPGLRSKFKPGAAVAKVTGQNITRNANNGLEWSARTGLWAHNLDLAARGWKRVFTGEAVVRTRKMAPDITDQEVQAVLAQMPARFSGTDVYRDFKRLAKSKGMSESAAESYADRLGRDWANKISVAEAEASRVVDKVFFDLSERNIDRFLKGVIPFHMWYTRALPFYAEAGMRHPGFAAAYYRMLEATDKQAEQEGWPSSLRGFIKLGTGPGGIAMFFNPVASLSLLDAFIVRDGGYTPENMSAIGKVLDRAADYGFGILPWWSAMLNYSGYLGDSSIGLDPIGTYGARKLFGGLVQIAATNGLFGEDWEKYLGKPFESALQDLRQLTSGKTPGSVNVPAGDPAAYGQQMINNIALTVYLRQKGITEEQYRVMGTQPYGSPGYKQWQEINDSVTADLDSQGPIYDEALDQYTASLGWNIFLDRIIQGGQKLRQIDQIERGNASATGVLGDVPGSNAKPFRMALTDPYSDGVVTQNEINWMREYKQTFGVTYKEGDLARMRAAIRAEKDMATVTPEARPLVVASMEYNMLGSDQDRIYVNYYNDIAFGDIPASKPIFVDGVTYTRSDLQGMTTDQRFNLADRWLEIHDTTGAARKLQDERAVYKDAHPEYKLYADWRKDVSKAWGDLGPRGLALYRSELVKENPNARRYFEDQQRTIIDRLRRRLQRDPSAAEVQAELDKATTSLAAYQAVKGIQTRITDPKPDDAGADPRPPGYSSGGTGSGASDKIPYDQKVRDAQDNMKAWLTKVNAALSQVYGQPVDYSMLPGPVKAAADAQLERIGITAPDDANLYWAYVKWRSDQMRIGGNSSIEAFIAATDKTSS